MTRRIPIIAALALVLAGTASCIDPLTAVDSVIVVGYYGYKAVDYALTHFPNEPYVTFSYEWNGDLREGEVEKTITWNVNLKEDKKTYEINSVSVSMGYPAFLEFQVSPGSKKITEGVPCLMRSGHTMNKYGHYCEIESGTATFDLERDKNSQSYRIRFEFDAKDPDTKEKISVRNGLITVWRNYDPYFKIRNNFITARK